MTPGSDVARAQGNVPIAGARGDGRESRREPFEHGMLGDEHRTPETIMAYRRTTEDLYRMMIADREANGSPLRPFEIDVPLTDAIGQFLEWFQSQHGRWAPATIRGHRSAIVGWIQTVLVCAPDHDEATVDGFVARALDLDAGPTPCAATEVPRTSARKRKSIRPAEHSRIILELTPRSGPGGPKADRMTELTRLLAKHLVHIGLRPVEVHGFEPVSEKRQLSMRAAENAACERRAPTAAEANASPADDFLVRVVNAKTTNGRGNGPTRTLDLSAFTADERREIERMRVLAAALLERHGCADLLHKALSERLARACDRAGIPRTCFYTMRHQALATAKAHMTREEVSALAGHGVTRTGVESYGRKASAWKTAPKARPTGADVDRVRDNARTWRRSARVATPR